MLRTDHELRLHRALVLRLHYRLAAWQSVADIRRQLVDVIELLATSDDVNEHLQPAIRSFIGTRRER